MQQTDFLIQELNTFTYEKMRRLQDKLTLFHLQVVTGASEVMWVLVMYNKICLCRRALIRGKTLVEFYPNAH
ncbi:hypothetical protein XELAEV_18044808mg [Xenopus laevis]|uniref:Uncharacterized protein n=1 Tax=Xenopus laevis TaxID=8355 RepID=A0A974H3M3_XENLA|nr:hypothetical protein XELAEV_18044808mg [Xenopus laevis]